MEAQAPDNGGSPVAIKKEPVEARPFTTGEVINLLEDDDEDDMDTGCLPRLSTSFKASPQKYDEPAPPVSQDDDDDAAPPIEEPIEEPQENDDAAPPIEEPQENDEPAPPVEEAQTANRATTLDLGTSILGPGKKQSGTERLLAAQRKHAYLVPKIQQGSAKATAPPAEVEAPQSTENFTAANSPQATEDVTAAKFAKVKQAYVRKKRAGTVTVVEEIEWMKAEAAEQSRLKKMKLDEEYDRTTPSDDSANDGIFVLDDPPSPKPSALSEIEDPQPKKRGRKRNNAHNDNETEESEQPARKRKASTISRKGRKVTEATYPEADVGDALERGKRQAAKNKATPKAKGNASKKNAGPCMTNVNSIRGTDVFRDTAKVQNLPSQPKFAASTRPDAFKQMVAASLEEGSTKKDVTADKKYLDDAIKAFTGTGSLKPSLDGLWNLKGMRSTLEHYQVLGVAFLRRRENSSTEPRGGILADDMGLGKTVMMIANIINGMPKDTARRKTTLIVASPALVTQWAHEIEKHCLPKSENKHGIGNVIQHRPGARVRSNNPVKVLEGADVVLTTYTEVCRSYPKAVIPPELVTAKQKADWWTSYYEQEKGLLHRMKFHRVVLDEAQAIKNHRSHTSLACRTLEARHYWAITGTPVMNTIKEFVSILCGLILTRARKLTLQYPYFRFLKQPHTGSYKIFKENFCKPNDADGTSRLVQFLKRIMCRRTHADEFFSARLLDLPPPQEHTVWLEFSGVERQIYEIVKRRFIERINCMAKRGTLEKQYSHIWIMILRLRQMCGHILLVQGTVVDLLEREDFEKLNAITLNEDQEDQQNDEGANLLIHLRNVLKDNAGVKTIRGSIQGAVISSSESVPTGSLDIDNHEQQTGGKHGLSFKFRRYLTFLVKSEHWDAITQRTLCTGCRQPPQNPQVTSCFHIYCLSCLTDLQHMDARRGHDRARCSECGDTFTNAQACEGLDTVEAARTTARSASIDQQSPQKARKAGGGLGMDSWINMPGQVLPSAKTMACKAQILNWFQETPGVKVIVYTQFLPMVRILGRICQTEKWGYVNYTGAMSHDARDKAIEEFREKPEKQIMLASLQAGGYGLNLTVASRVILLDPWWNAAVEQQAFARVFRITQTKETRFTRFVIKNSIDSAMQATKDRKQMEIDEVMDDSRRNEQLSVEELMRLFGEVREDDEGKPFIFAEGDDRDDHRLVTVDEEDEDAKMGNEE